MPLGSVPREVESIGVVEALFCRPRQQVGTYNNKANGTALTDISLMHPLSVCIQTKLRGVKTSLIPTVQQIHAGSKPGVKKRHALPLGGTGAVPFQPPLTRTQYNQDY